MNRISPEPRRLCRRLVIVFIWIGLLMGIIPLAGCRTDPIDFPLPPPLEPEAPPANRMLP